MRCIIRNIIEAERAGAKKLMIENNMTLTLDEWSESTEVHRKLKKNLEVNIRMLCDRMTDEERESLLRLNLIMVRQFELDGTKLRNQFLKNLGLSPKIFF